MRDLRQNSADLLGKLMPLLDRVSNNKYIKAISNAMMGTLSVSIIGSIAVLLISFPMDGVQNFINMLGIVNLLNATFRLTTGLLALYIVFLVAKNIVKEFLPSDDGSMAGLIGIFSFLILTPLGQLDDGGFGIPFTWLGSEGVFSALIIGVLTGRIYVFVKDKGWTVKMPPGVPPMVIKVFESLIPSILIALIFFIVSRLFEGTAYGSMHATIYNLIQIPLTGIGGSFSAMLLVAILAQTLWFFGIHGTNIIRPLVNPIWLAMDIANLEAFMAGTELPHIMGGAFFSTVTFGATTLGLVVNMLMSKSKRYKDFGKMTFIPALFGVTEPIVFGMPLVLNFKLAIPFIFNNAIILTIAYALTAIGIVPRFPGVSAIFGLPLGFAAAIQGSAMIVIMHVALQLLSILLWRPFFKLQEKEQLQAELESVE